MPRRAPRWGDHRLTFGAAALTCALAPAYTVRWHLGPYPTTVLELAILATLVIFVLESAHLGSLPRLRTPYTIPALLFLVAGAIDVFTAPDRRAALGLYRAYLVEPIAFGLVAAEACRSARRALLLAAGLGVGALAAGVPNSVVVLEAIRHHAYQVSQTPPVVIYETANALGLYLDPLVALAGALVLHECRPRARLGAIAFLVIALPVLLLTFSRGSYLALAAVAVALALTHRHRLPLLAGLAVAALALSEVPLIHRRLQIETENVSGNTANFRLDIWTATLRLLRQRPVFGAGLSGFQARIAPFWNAAHPNERFIDPHNIVLNFWVETGILGLLSFVWIWVAGFAVSFQGWRRGAPVWRPLHLGVLLALVAVAVHGLVDVPYFKNDLSLEFWALLAITWAGRRWAASRPGLEAAGSADESRAIPA